jgi:hypothetical protein
MRAGEMPRRTDPARVRLDWPLRLRRQRATPDPSGPPAAAGGVGARRARTGFRRVPRRRARGARGRPPPSGRPRSFGFTQAAELLRKSSRNWDFPSSAKLGTDRTGTGLTIARCRQLRFRPTMALLLRR